MKNDELSMVDTAFKILSSVDEPYDFFELWDKIAEEKGMTDEEKEASISSFYTSITLDGRMIIVGDNRWDLRSRHRFDEVHIDMKDVYSDEDDVISEDNDDEMSLEDNYNDN